MEFLQEILIFLIFHHRRIGGGVAYNLGILKGNIGVKEEVYIKFRRRLVRCGGGYAHGVNENVGSLFGINKGKVVVVLIHG